MVFEIDGYWLVDGTPAAVVFEIVGYWLCRSAPQQEIATMLPRLLDVSRSKQLVTDGSFCVA
jgi:hypothetical protein